MRSIISAIFVSAFCLMAVYSYSALDSDESVWICTGRYSKKYHLSKDGCRGMQNCKGEKFLVAVKDAEADGKSKCGYCYQD